MNKVFYYGKKAKVYAENHDEILSRAKAGITGFLGEDRAGSVCSCLDYADFVYVDPIFPAKKNSSFTEKLVRKFQSSKIVFKHSDFARYFLKTRLAHAPKQSVYEEVEDVRKIVYTIDPKNDAEYFADLDTRTGDLKDFVVLPVIDGNNFKIHELLHVISSKPYKIETAGSSWYTVKKGLSCVNKYDYLSEIFTDYLADKVDDYMKSNNLPLIGEAQRTTSVYNVMKRYVRDIFDKYFDTFIDSYLGADVSAIDQCFGATNLEELSLALEDMHEIDNTYKGSLSKYVLYKNTSSAETKEKLLSTINKRLDNGQSFLQMQRAFELGQKRINAAKEKCLKEAASKNASRNNEK